jgi:capsular exopolysaccharide synthesis family protein
LIIYKKEFEMAKTFEALEKAKNEYFEDVEYKKSKNIRDVSEVLFLDSDWSCPNLSNTKEMGSLYQRIFYSETHKKIQVYSFVSSNRNEGTSTIVVNLAKRLFKKASEEKVLFIDANAIHPVLHTAFAKNNTPGLNDVIYKKAELDNAISPLQAGQVYFLPIGLTSILKEKIYFQKHLDQIISVLRRKFEYIIIDSSPLLISSDSISFASVADTCILVVLANSSRWEIIEKSKNYLSEHKCNISGVILNRIGKPIPKWLYGKL